MKALHFVSFILLAIGGLNWGLVGLAGLVGDSNWNLVNLILGSMPALENIVYVLVGLSAAMLIATHKGECRQCEVAAGPQQAPEVV